MTSSYELMQFSFSSCMMFMEAKTPYFLSFHFNPWFNTTQILWTVYFLLLLDFLKECIAATFI